MRAIVKGRWFVLAAWIAAVAVLLFLSPNMTQLVSEKGSIEVPEGYSSRLADDILANAQETDSEDESQVALVFHKDDKLTKADYEEAKEAIQTLDDNKTELGITEITSHFTNDSLKSELVSEDETSILTAITINIENKDTEELTNQLYQKLNKTKLEHYYTSSWMIDNDFNHTTEEGLRRTEGITLVFILAVLLLVFRSIVAPLIPLVTVGFTYIAAQSVVAMLVDTFNFPISSYTQIFLVVILFGIGTDYCILLLSRFKEELSKHEDITDAIAETYRTAGKTVLFSGLAVMIGFAAIGLSQFKLYQSASGVAVGVALLLVALLTIVPFFMAVLGRRLFWPSKGSIEHKDSKLWDVIGRFSLARPFLALLLVAVVTIPALLFYDGELSYNSLEEVGDDVGSVKAFNLISDHFGPGESMPTQIVLKNDEEMNSQEYMGLAEGISEELRKVDNVSAVRSVTRPTGEVIKDFFVSNQAEELEKGIGEGNSGVKEIRDGLNDANNELKKSEPQMKEATNGINNLISGTSELKSGMSEVQNNLTKLEEGMRQGTASSAQLKAGLEELKKNTEELLSGSNELLQGYENAASGLTTLEKESAKIQTGLKVLNTHVANLGAKGLEHDTDYQAIRVILNGDGTKKNPGLSNGLDELNEALGGAASDIQTANKSFTPIIDGQKAISKGLTQLIDGLEQQLAGLAQLADGQKQLNDNFPQLTNGLDAVNDGQKELLDGFGTMNGQISQLTDGLSSSTEGLDQIHKGLGSAENYLTELASSGNAAGFYLPEEALTSDEFKESLETYLRDDNKVMTFDVIFEKNPYSNEAIDEISEIKSAVHRATKDTKLENATVAVGGITSTSADLGEMSNSDYSNTVILMLVGIGIILVLMLRSIIMPLYLILSLVITYYTAMAFTEIIYVDLLGYGGISWAVPFFAFVILIALGVDYSIFLMDRFTEYHELPIAEAMHLAMKKMGTVIISAAIILGGTFAAMMPSGVLSLLQISTVTLIGLFLYALFILPLFIPVMAKMFGKANWYPFVKK
ncbi:MMPL family transporter [Bacillus gobiensis]|uniref:MMPL family transporter n=1 Tax=Bacillus gobiensis TaxID=1441095 RepID=UPI003D25F12C